MSEAQKVKRPRTLTRFVASLRYRRRRRPERNKPRFVGMDRQAVLAKSLRKNFRHAMGVAVVAKPHGKVIRKADQEGSMTKARCDLV
ncbi:MAG TPA: hypothetical protein VMY37_33445 [Thermoguttaceae bacterium]|nr:hypothetical protein [Thermoguttaceae bacterium]